MNDIIVWKEIPGYGGNYVISNTCVIKGVSRIAPGTYKKNRRIKERVLTHTDDGQGYRRVKLRYNGKEKKERVHRLLAICFIPNPENKPCINHKNGVRDDNRIENIEWCTKQENANHKYEVLKYKHPVGEAHKLSKSIFVVYPDGNKKLIIGLSEAARQIGGHPSNISAVLKGKVNSHKGLKFEYA